MSRLETVRCLMVAALLFAATNVLANPLGGKVVGGSATIQGQGTPGVVIDQSSQNAIINWQSFNIGAGEVTQFNQPNSSSVSLNRVTGDQNPSTIFGTLNANGRVFLVNPDGFLFGPGSSINTAGFLATTHDISNEDFLAGRYNFNIPGNPQASIVNEGTISISDAGIAVLVAPGVRNDGVITARLGKIGLSSANSFTLDLYGDNLINFSLTDPIAAQVIDVKTGKPLRSLVENRGRLSANGGVVALTATTARALVDSVVNNSGVIEARTIGVHNGRIVLGGPTAKTKLAGSPTQKVVVKGTLGVAGQGKGQTGGEVQITGEAISVAGANIDASGTAGGGKVLIGGDAGGGTPSAIAVANPIAGLEVTSVPTASTVVVDDSSTINVSALYEGNGGKAIVWSDGTTDFNGSILAHGGATAGNGGFVETSGHDGLQFSGRVDTSATNGQTGTLLLDPTNVTIGSSGSWIVTVSDLEAALLTNNVVVNTSAPGTDAGNITVAQSVTWANGNSLTLSADHDITVMPGVTISNSGAGNLILRADDAGIGTGSVNLSAGAVNYSGSTGTVSIFYDPQFGYVFPLNYAPSVATNLLVLNQLTAYMLVNNVSQLQAMQQNLSGSYSLGKDINASSFAFAPVGDGANPLNGALFGDGRLISNLTISSIGGNVGFFGNIGPSGKVSRLGLVNVNVSNGSSYEGGLVGVNQGSVSQVFVTGSVSTVANNTTIGGLVGINVAGASITDSYANVQVSGGPGSSVGGFAGWDNGAISRSYSFGHPTGGAIQGGFAAILGNPAVVTNSYWDTLTSGGAGGGAIFSGPVTNNSVGLTTATLKSALPTGFNSSVWGLAAAVNGGYPYLLWQVASTSPPATTKSGVLGPPTLPAVSSGSVPAGDPTAQAQIVALQASNSPVVPISNFVPGFVAPTGIYTVPVHASGSAAGFFDPSYNADLPKADWRQHTGVDLSQAPGTPVASPVSGTVIGFFPSVTDPTQSFLVIQEAGSTIQHVLGHITSKLQPGQWVSAGDPVGAVAAGSHHVHWGANVNGIPITPDSAGFGWGKAPFSATREQALQRGWIDLSAYRPSA